MSRARSIATTRPRGSPAGRLPFRGPGRFGLATPGEVLSNSGQSGLALHCDRKPPSTATTCPVTKDASFETSHTTALATSSGVPRRLIGKPAAKLSAYDCSGFLGHRNGRQAKTVRQVLARWSRHHSAAAAPEGRRPAGPLRAEPAAEPTRPHNALEPGLW